MKDWLKDVLQGRPWWMNVLMIFSAYMALIYVPWDFFVKPVAEDHEVWFGVTFTGVWAKWLAIPHEIVYAGALYGFLRRRPWMAVWGPLYLAQVTIAMAVWPILHEGGGRGWVMGAVAGVPFAALTFAFWNARAHFLQTDRALTERYGEWALVTGASAGIGAAFARALAREGLNVVVTARRRDRLEALASEIEADHPVRTRVVEVDLTAPEGPEQLLDAVQDLPIGVLINNAGFGYGGRFEKVEAERLKGMVNLNCLAPSVLTHRLLPSMLHRHRGAIVFTGSVAGRQPLPLHGLYSATKGFDSLLAEALYVETRGTGVDVLVLEPGTTATEFQEVAGEIQHGGESPEAVVEVALTALGQQPTVISGWWNWLRAVVPARLAPRSLVAFIARHVMEVRMPADRR